MHGSMATICLGLIINQEYTILLNYKKIEIFSYKI